MKDKIIPLHLNNINKQSNLRFWKIDTHGQSLGDMTSIYNSVHNGAGIGLLINILFVLITFTVFSNFVYAETQDAKFQPSDSQVFEMMSELNPLPKIHYSAPVSPDLLSSRNDPTLYEFARLTHAISLQAESVKRVQIMNAVRACKAVNKTNPSIPCSLAINYSPWHQRFGNDLPPTDFGETHQEEVDLFQSKLEKVKEDLGYSNKKLKTNITLSAVLLTSSRFKIGEGSEQWHDEIIEKYGFDIDVDEWNGAIMEKHQIINDIADNIFPSVRVENYGQGGWGPAASSTGWMQANYFGLNEVTETYSVFLSRITELAETRESFRRTLESATQHGVNNVTPWISLAAGYRRQIDVFHKWGAWDYDLVYSWQIGAEVNYPWFGGQPERFAPWFAAEVVVLYPNPFSTKYSAWAKHFIAYVRGANINKDLSGLE